LLVAYLLGHILRRSTAHIKRRSGLACVSPERLSFGVVVTIRYHKGRGGQAARDGML
jgi:hypothetical protein